MKRSHVALLLVAVLAAACDDGVSPQPEAVASVQVTSQVSSLAVNDTLRLAAVARGRDGAALPGHAISWSSSNQAVATVSVTGLVRAIAPGSATVTAAAGGRSATVQVAVVAHDTGIGSVLITTTPPPLAPGATFQLAAVARNAAGTTLPSPTFTWSSSNEAVVTVSATGLVTAVAPGTAQVSATAGDRSGSVGIVVQAPGAGAPATVELNATTAELEEGAEFQFIATVKDANGTPIHGLGMHWSTSAADIVANVGGGRVRAVRAGSAEISVRVQGITATATVEVRTDYGYELVYDRGAGQVFDSFVLDIGQPGAQPVQILGGDGIAGRPTPSPDGTRIAFACRDAALQLAICIANRDGGDRRMLSAPDGEAYVSPSWSPDGTRLAYTRFIRRTSSTENDRFEVWVMNADFSGRVALTAGMPGAQRSPAWSPRLADGTERIAFVQDLHFTNGNNHIWVMRPDGSDRRQLTSGSDLTDDAPSWSPDGDRLAFQRITGWAGTGIMLMNRDGSHVRPLFIGAGIQYSPAWSPDGRLVAFTSTHETWGSGVNEYQVYTVRADGSGVARRTFDAGNKYTPAWLPLSAARRW
jgi:uncharacterized protein YjdB